MSESPLALQQQPVANAPSPAAVRDAADSGRAADGRDPYFDNAKLFAIMLVVCAHFWEPLAQHSGSRPLHAVYDLVYAFHMPVFIFISGYFSRSFSAKPRQLRRLLTGVLLPYLLWSTLLGLYTNAISGGHTAINPLKPVWVTWFLAALFLWRLTAPFWSLLRMPLLVAGALSLAAGLFPLGSELAFARTVQFLPFFVAGLTITPERMTALRNSRVLRFAAVPVFATAAVAAYWAVPRLPLNWLYREKDASQMHVSYAHWLVESVAINVGGALLGVLFLSVIPKGRSWLTGLGAASMCAFLLHGFLQRTFIYRDVYHHALLHHIPGQVALTLGALTLTLLLCTSPVRRLTRPFMEPRLDWLFRPAPTGSSDGRAGQPT